MAHINNKLAAYLDEELDARIRAEVEEHLNVCQQCRQELEEIRLGAMFAQKRPIFTPSDQVWENLEKEIIANKNTKSSKFIKIRKQSSKRFLYLSSAFAAVVLLVTGWWWWSSNQPVQIDLDQYLSALEAQPEDRFPRAFGVLPSGFERVDAPIAVKAANIEQVGTQIPVADFELVSCRMRRISGHDVIQFLYGKSSQAFVVFVANKAVKFIFADREIGPATVQELSGGTINSDGLATFWTGGGDFQTLLVSRFKDAELTAAIARHFVAAHSEQKK